MCYNKGMKKNILLFITVFVCANLFAASTDYAPGQVLYVSVKTVKSGKNVFAYGDKLIVDECNGKKVLVHLADNKSVNGWIPSTSLTKKKIVANKNGSHVSASSDELALAGKGFSEAAEELFKSDNPNLDFNIIDKIETISVEQSELDKFIKDGHLCEN